MNITKETFIKIYDEQVNNIDEELIAVLKGHLLIEKVLNQIIHDFVFHEDKINEARLSFYQKVLIARSMSLDESDNSMWNLVLTMNSLRNDLAHQIDSEKRNEKTEKLRNLYVQEAKGSDFEKIWDDNQVIGIAYTTCFIVGFLLAFHEEILRLKTVVKVITKTMNTHS